METIKKFWSLSFKVKKGDFASFIGVFLIYTAIEMCADLLAFYFSDVGLWGFFVRCLSIILDVYALLGIISCSWCLFGLDTVEPVSEGGDEKGCEPESHSDSENKEE